MEHIYRFSFSPRTCQYRFTVPEESSIRVKSISAHNVDRQVCEIMAEDSKNLAAVETRTETGQREATEKAEVTESLWHLRKIGYEASTAKGYVDIIKMLRRQGVNLLEPESVKMFMAQQNWKIGRKANVVKAYSAFLRMRGLEWDKPRCKPKERLAEAAHHGTGQATHSGVYPKIRNDLQLHV